MFLLAQQSDLSNALELTKQFGPLLVAVIFFIWRDWKREDRLMRRIEKLEDEHRNIVLPLVKKSTEVIEQNTAALRALSRG
jgi:hypothetical protein